MNPDTPPTPTRPLGTVLRYSFALLAGGAFAWMAWTPAQPKAENGESAPDGSRNRVIGAAPGAFQPAAVQSSHSFPAGENQHAISRNHAIAPGSRERSTQDTVKNKNTAREATAATPDLDAAETSDLHLRGPP